MNDKLEVLIAMILGVLFAIGLIYALAWNDSLSGENVSGVITNIQISAGGFGHADITTVYLDNGVVLPITGRETFTIGTNYTFYYDNSGEIDLWQENP